MSFYTQDEEQFVKKCISIKTDAINNSKITLLRFLNSRELYLLKYICGNDVYLYESIITADDEYKRAVVSLFEIKPDFKISLLRIDYNKKYLKPNHRMILGALMSQGITRDSVGDIFITTNNDVYLTVTDEILPYIIREFRTISHQSITLVNEKEIIGEIKYDYDIKQAFVQSLRLDLIIAERFNLSRSEAQDLIKESNCKVNQKPITNTSYVLKEGDSISLKGHGKMKLLEVGGLSKHDKIFVRLAKLL